MKNNIDVLLKRCRDGDAQKSICRNAHIHLRKAQAFPISQPVTPRGKPISSREITLSGRTRQLRLADL